MEDDADEMGRVSEYSLQEHIRKPSAWPLSTVD